MQIKRQFIRNLAATLSGFDPSGSPYIGIQLQEETVLARRTSPVGYIESLGFEAEGKTTVVSLSHFERVANNMPDESIELSLDSFGILRMACEHHGLPVVSQVHTIRSGSPWSHNHAPGYATKAIDISLFQDIKTRSFRLASPPVLKARRLVLPTQAGTICRTELCADAYPYPRGTFLNTVAGRHLSQLGLTAEGYWFANYGDMQIAVTGHRTGESILPTLDAPEEIFTELPSQTLLEGLVKESKPTPGTEGWMEISAERGVVSRDEHANESAWSFGEVGHWKAFSITPATARTIIEALSQGSGDRIQLSSLPHPSGIGPRIIRFTRGLWSVTVNVR